MIAIISVFLLIFIIFSIVLLYTNMKLHRRIEKHEKKEMDLFDEIETLNRVKSRLKKEIDEIQKENTVDKKYSGKKVIIGNNLKSGALITQKLLQNMGFTVEIVQDPQDIIDSIKTGEHYDAIITNNLYNFGKTGEELLHALREIKGFKTPVIVHTIDKGNEFYYVNQLGFDGYLEKPLDENSVIRVMDHLLN